MVDLSGMPGLSGISDITSHLETLMDSVNLELCPFVSGSSQKQRQQLGITCRVSNGPCRFSLSEGKNARWILGEEGDEKIVDLC